MCSLLFASVPKRLNGARFLLLLVLALWVAPDGAFAQTRFLRGDSNVDGSVDLSDAIYAFDYLLLGGAAPLCLDAADSNDDARVDIADGVQIIRFLFQSGAPLPAPGRYR